MTEIRNLTRNGETFYPLTHEKAVIGMEDFKDTITEQIDNYRPIEITGDVTNAPDEEDITSDANNLLKFKNRNNLYGLGKVILRRGSSFASQVTLANTIYVIQYNFDLGSARINVPNGSILLFEGGTLFNGTLVCADLYDVRLVYYQDQSEILSNVTLEGNFIHKACDKDTIRQILVDNSSITKDANDVLSVKANGIQNNHLNSNVVDASSIVLDSNNKISIKDGGVTGSKLNSTVVNTDDLSIINNKIQLANRGTANGMGKIILRKDQSFASQLTQQNTIYVIRYDYTLTGNVTIPSNCILEFDGGSVSGGTIIFTDTIIRKQYKNAFFNCRFSGSLAQGQILNISSFGVHADGVTKDGFIINDVCQCVAGKGCEIVMDCDGDYAMGDSRSSDAVRVGSNTIMTFTGKGFLKAVGRCAGGGMLYAAGTEENPVSNVVFNNPQIDGGGANGTIAQFGLDGFGFLHCKDITINGGIVKRCYAGTSTGTYGEEGYVEGDGGAGIQMEHGDIKNLTIQGTYFEDCRFSIRNTRTFEATNEPIECKIVNIKAKLCDYVLCNIIRYSTDENIIKTGAIINLNGLIAENCGVAIDDENPVDDGAIFLFSRGRSSKISNVTIFGNNKINNIIRGRHAYCTFENITVLQPCMSLINNSPLSRTYGEDTTQSIYNNYEIYSLSTYSDKIAVSDGNITKSQLKFSNLKVFLSNYIGNVSNFGGSIFSSGTSNLNINFNNEKAFVGPAAIFNIVYSYTPDNLSTIEYSKGYVPYGNSIANAPSASNINADYGKTFYTLDYRMPCFWNGWYWTDGAGKVIAKRHGETTDRPKDTNHSGPMHNNADYGTMYFDTTLGKPIWWNGTKWVKADGTDADA